MNLTADVILAAGVSQAAGPLGFLVVVLIGITTALLIRNMNGRLKRMPKEFDPPAGGDRPDPDSRP